MYADVHPAKEALARIIERIDFSLPGQLEVDRLKNLLRRVYMYTLSYTPTQRHIGRWKRIPRPESSGITLRALLSASIASSK